MKSKSVFNVTSVMLFCLIACAGPEQDGDYYKALADIHRMSATVMGVLSAAFATGAQHEIDSAVYAVEKINLRMSKKLDDLKDMPVTWGERSKKKENIKKLENTIEIQEDIVAAIRGKDYTRVKILISQLGRT